MLNKKTSRSLPKKNLNNIVKVAAPRFISSMYVNRLKLGGNFVSRSHSLKELTDFMFNCVLFLFEISS